MMTVLTGMPGNGKTLYLLVIVEALRQLSIKEGKPRNVYVHGVPELTLPWLQLDDPKKWNELPPGSIIVIDECQKTFPPRPSSSKPPEYVQPFETHRHKGYDIFLITQHPSLIDNHIKKLSNKHYHLIRQFGMQRSTVFEMQSVNDPTNSNLKQAIRHPFKFPKHVYSWYKSAEVHTHKAKIPFKIVLLLLLLIAAPALFFWTIHRLNARGGVQEDSQVKGVQKSPALLPATASSNSNRPMTQAEYVAQYTARIPGLDYTAPVYDALTKPKRVPVPAACVTYRGGCNCYSQQGTRLPVLPDQCAQIVRTGFFMAFDPDGDRPPEPPKPVQSEPVVMPQLAPQPQVVVVNDMGRNTRRPPSAMDLEVFDEPEPAVKRLVRR